MEPGLGNKLGLLFKDNKVQMLTTGGRLSVDDPDVPRLLDQTVFGLIHVISDVINQFYTKSKDSK